MSDDQDFQIAYQVLSDERPLAVTIRIQEAWHLVAALQLACRHPGVNGPLQMVIERIAHQFQDAISAAHPEADELIQRGWNPACDVNEVGQPVNGSPTRHVTNVWTLYRLNPDGSEAEHAFAQLSRPQDWGDAQKWKHKVYRLRADLGDITYEHEVHCWAEQPIEDGEHLKLFAPLVATILQPGMDVRLCGPTHLAMDDFWEDEWGDLPPPVDEDDDGFEWDDEVRPCLN